MFLNNPKKEEKMKKKIIASPEAKIFILDTSVCLHDSSALQTFSRDVVVFPLVVIEELDKKKELQNGKGLAARETIRRLDKYREIGSLHTGVKTDQGGMVFVSYVENGAEKLPAGMTDQNDNIILLTALEWKKNYPDRIITLVTKDANLRIKADSLGIQAEDYKKGRAINNLDSLYSGFMIISIEGKHDLYHRFGREKKIPAELVIDPTELLPNQCCYLELDRKRYALAIYKAQDQSFHWVPRPHPKEKGKIAPINQEQAFAWALLSDPTISLVTLEGKAGTGKTLLALKVGYDLLCEKNGFKQVLVFRPNVEIGKELGYRPGTHQEKVAPLASAIFDNFELIGSIEKQIIEKQGISRKNYNLLEELINTGLVEINTINHIRGRSIPNRFVIIDDAQNLSPEFVKTIVTRAGDDTKLVFTGDPHQIDDKYLDPLSNGFVHLIERMKGQEIFGHIRLTKTERSKLAELGALLL